MNTHGSPVAKDRLGLLLVAVTLVVMVAVGFFAHQHRIKLNLGAIQQLGQSLVRALAAAEFSKLANPDTGKTLLNRVAAPSADGSLAYATVVRPDGGIVYAIGPATPALRVLPKEPHAWFGEARISITDSQREAIEFHAPLMQDGNLAGFLRLAYFSEPGKGWLADMPFIASLLLPVGLLMLAAYLIVHYEIRSLAHLSRRLTTIAHTLVPEQALESKGTNVIDFKHHIDQFIALVQRWTEDTRNATLAAHTAAHLITYRQEKAEAVLHAMPDAVMIVDEDCLPTFANTRAEHLIGCKLDAMVGKPARDWCSNAEVQAFLMKFRNAPAAPGLSSLTYSPNHMPERRIKVSVHALISPRDPDSLVGRLVLFHDITSEFLARQSGAEFVAHAAHELKTPLATLTTYSENLFDYAMLTETDRVESINVINEEARRMANLISNLLNIAKLDAGTLQLVRKRVKIHELLQDSFDAVSPIAHKREIAMQLRIPPDLGSAKLDKELLRIAIDNIVENGVKYSNPGGEVILSAEVLDKDELQITVRDRGIGISRHDCTQIFDKHYRAGTSEATSRAGHGLGLYLARQIIELHQGRIMVDSELGKGTVFTITLKAQPMSLEESQSA
jgi:signal transduction histidine kinase